MSQIAKIFLLNTNLSNLTNGFAFFLMSNIERTELTELLPLCILRILCSIN